MKKHTMSKCLFLLGVLSLAAPLTRAQDNYPKVETSPAFMFIRTPTSFNVSGHPTVNESFNCAGGGGTFTYNVSSLVGLGADLGGCGYFGGTLGQPISSDLSGNTFTFLFGPRFTFRNSSRFEPFTDLNFGGAHLSLTCNNNVANLCPGNPSFSTTAFALTVGGGLDIKLSKKVALRLVQAEYLYTHFGNGCSSPLCSGNEQNSFRLKSGIVINWGGSAK